MTVEIPIDNENDKDQLFFFEQASLKVFDPLDA
jgi:hypothetical protein